MQGWIKLHRKIFESPTFLRLDAKQMLIAIFLILKANHKDGFWPDFYKGEDVKVLRGQLITSRSIIVNEWFKNDKTITEQVVRTALAKLEKLNFITKQSTKRYTRITIENYDTYQSEQHITNQVINQNLTNNQPSNNQDITTNKNEKNEKKQNKKEETYLDTVKYNTNSDQMNLDVEKDNLLKDSLQGSVPIITFNILKAFSDDYDEMFNWIGIIFRAKKSVEEKRDELLQIEFLDQELSQTLSKCIRKIKRESRIENNDNYLFKSLYNFFETLSMEMEDSLY